MSLDDAKNWRARFEEQVKARARHEQVEAAMIIGIRGIYIEQARRAASLLAEIISAPDEVMLVVDPYQSKLHEAHRALMEIQNKLRQP